MLFRLGLVLLLFADFVRSAAKDDPTCWPCSKREEIKASYTSIEARKKQQEDVMSKILPMLAMPFIISTTLLPMMLTSLKFMVLKSIILGKFAIFFAALTLLRNASRRGGLYSHNVNIIPSKTDMNEMYKAHYGYTGDEEYGAYVNRKRKR